jgi:hypothetical protein
MRTGVTDRHISSGDNFPQGTNDSIQPAKEPIFISQLPSTIRPRRFLLQKTTYAHENIGENYNTPACGWFFYGDFGYRHCLPIPSQGSCSEAAK